MPETILSSRLIGRGLPRHMRIQYLTPCATTGALGSMHRQEYDDKFDIKLAFVYVAACGRLSCVPLMGDVTT